MTDRSLGIIGIGAFGSLAVRHLSPFFSLVLHDPGKDLARIAKSCGGKDGTLEEAAACDIVMLAVPVQQMKEVLKAISPMVKPGALVIDVASVKVRPAEMMRAILPKETRIVATHPLFGPQSGKNGIKGLNIVICPVRGKDFREVRRFCRNRLGLRVFISTPEEHDKEMAIVQGLTHLVSRAVRDMKIPEHRFVTKTYSLMHEMVKMVGNDSDELFQAIERENPYAADAKARFFASIRRMDDGKA